MIEDKLTRQERLRLECYDRAVLRAVQRGGSVSMETALQKAREIEEYVSPSEATETVPDRPSAELAAQRIFEALGEVSMCWLPRPTGVFDSTRAAGIGRRLLEKLGYQVPEGYRDREPEPGPGTEYQIDIPAALMNNTDARDWAAAFMAIQRNRDRVHVDEGLMLGWFANAIEVGRDVGRGTAAPYDPAGDELRVTLHLELKPGYRLVRGTGEIDDEMQAGFDLDTPVLLNEQGGAAHSHYVTDVIDRVKELLINTTEHNDTIGWMVAGVTA